MGQIIELTASDGHTFSAYRAEPSGSPRGGVVVLQEIWGVNDHIRRVTDGYAAEGYLAIAPALFDRVERNLAMDAYTPETRTRGFATMQKVEHSQALLDIGAAVAAASPVGKVGVVGFCFGGRLAWLSAARIDGISAAVAYYGGGIPGMVAEQPRCPVIFHFGERDQNIPIEAVKTFSQAHPSLPVYIYPADHGFNCDQRGAWEPDCAKLANGRTLEFLGNLLEHPATTGH
ncbi:MAG TPA: dienelactone hydrolase family protein [Terriglobia bacterium]|nr:dienelactone hydrolase family protein [Terriglobia bacterium]